MPSSGARSPSARSSPLEEDEPVEGPEPQDHLADDVADRHGTERARVRRRLPVVAQHEDRALRHGEREPDRRRLWRRGLPASRRILDELSVDVDLAIAKIDGVST